MELSDDQTFLMELSDVHTARFLKYVWPIFNIMEYRVKGFHRKRT